MKQFIVLLLVLISHLSFGQVDDSWRDSLIVARKAYEKKDYAKALKYYESAQRKAPDNIDLSDEMAQSAYRMREFERAEKIYQQGSGSKKSKKERSDAMHNLGNAQMKQKNYQGAIDSYKEALRNNPKDDQTRYNLSEAIRKLQDEQKNPPPPKDPNNPQNPKDPKNPDKENDQNGQSGNSKQNSSKQGGKKGQQPKNQGNPSKGNSQSQNGQGDSKNGGEPSKGKLSNQMVERALNEIAEKEAETKRRLRGTTSGGKSSKSGKDW